MDVYRSDAQVSRQNLRHTQTGISSHSLACVLCRYIAISFYIPNPARSGYACMAMGYHHVATDGSYIGKIPLLYRVWLNR